MTRQGKAQAKTSVGISIFALLRVGTAMAGSTSFAIKPGDPLRYAATIFEVSSWSRGSPEIAELSTSICTSAVLVTNSMPKSVAISSPEALEENWLAIQPVLADSERSKLFTKLGREGLENETLLLRTASATATTIRPTTANESRNNQRKD